jgi:autotransporter-associated beta strand protein
MSAPNFAASTNYTWNDKTGPGTDANWSTAANWTPTSGPPGLATTDTATFSGTASTFANPNLDTNESIGELVFGTAAGGWTLDDTSGSVLTLNGTGTTAGIGINALAQTSGTTTINANLNIAAAQTWEVGGTGTLLINGTLSGTQTATLNIGGTGTIDLTANSSGLILSGLTINSGTLDLSGSGQLGFMTPLVLNGGLLMADNTATAVNNRVNSFASGMQTFLNGGNFTLLGNTTQQVSEYLGTLNLGGYSPNGLTAPAAESTITLSSAGDSLSLIIDGFTRNVGGPTLFINGAGLGSASGINVASAPTFVSQDGVVTGTIDNPNIKDAAIVPYLVGEASGGIATQTGTPNTFIAYTGQSANSLRPLDPSTEFVNNAITGGANTYITAATAASSSASINSLVINGGNLNIVDNQNLTNYSGALLFVSNNAITSSGSGSAGTFTLGSSSANNEGIINVNSGITGTIGAPLTGSIPITMNGPGQLNLTALSNNYSGPVTLNFGTLQLGTGSAGNDATFGSSASVTVGGAANLILDNYSPSTSFPFLITTLTGSNIFFTQSQNLTVPVNISNASSFNFINFNNTGSLTITNAAPGGTNGVPGSAIDTSTAGVNTYMIFNGAPVNFAANVTSETLNSQYFYDRTSSPIVLSGPANNIAYSAKFYLQSINGSGTSGIFPNESVTIPAGASFSTALTSTSRTVYITNENNNINTGASAYKNQLPPPATFNMNGSMTTYIVYMGGYSNGGTSSIGQTTMNVVGTAASPAVLNADLYTAFVGATMPNTVVSSMIIGPYATEKSTPTSGFGFKLAIGGYGYFDVVGPSASVTDGTPTQAGSNELWLGTGGDALMEIGGSSIGLPSSGSAVVNVSDGAAPVAALSNAAGAAGTGFIFADSTGATNVATLSIFNGGVLNWNPGVASDTNFVMGMTKGQSATMNVIGGQYNNSGTNAPIEMGAVAGVNAILNINSDGSGNAGKVATSYITANAANSSAFLNFNGGELQYSNAGSAGAQANFINNIGGIYSYQNGAVIGSNGQNVTIAMPILAPTGSGITGINVGTAGTGYTSPPLVQITGGGGSDATGYAIINSSGAVTAVIITSPGFGYTSAPTIKFLDGGAPGTAGASYTFTAAAATAAVGPNATTGGLTKVDTGTVDLTSSGNTYSGPTIIQAGTLEIGDTSANGISASTPILVGDTLANNSAVLQVATTNTGGFVLTPGQVLAGFGKVLGQNASSPVPITFGGGTTVAPGTSSAVNTIKGSAIGTATGALSLTSGLSSPMATNLGSGGTYYWKLNLSSGGSGATSSPGTATTSDLSGTNWDALVLDTAAVTATPGSPFMVQAAGYGAPTSVNIGGSNAQSYSWTIARANDASFSKSLVASLLANTQLQLNSSGLPVPAAGYSYYLSGQNDPSLPSDTDLVVNYAPVPEPTALALLAPAAAAMLLRRRRKAGVVQTA